MGLRVKRYTPWVISDDVAPGLVGFMVVCARRKEAKAEKPKTTPINATTIAATMPSPNETLAATANEETSHMTRPKNTATRGGGIFSSSEPMATTVRPNV